MTLSSACRAHPFILLFAAGLKKSQDAARICYRAIVRVEIKTAGSSGQISLGKHCAGRTATVEQVAEGVWTVETAQVIPDEELWYTPKMRESLIVGSNGRHAIPVLKPHSARWQRK
jgi:hypothetical protein